MTQQPAQADRWPEPIDHALLQALAQAERLCDTAAETRSLRTLDAALTILRQSAPHVGTRHPYAVGLAAELGRCLRLRYELTSDPLALDEAVTHMRPFAAAAANGHPGHAHLPALLNNLGNVLLDCYQREHVTAHLEAAEKAYQDGMNLLDPGDPRYPTLVAGLCDAWLERVRGADGEQYLDRATQLLDAHPDRAEHLIRLGNAASDQYAATGNPLYLDHAERLFRQGVATTYPSDSKHGRLLMNLGNTQLARYTLDPDPKVMRTGVELLRQAVVHLGQSEDAGLAQANLGTALLTCYQHEHDRVLLGQAEHALRCALMALPTDHSRRPLVYNSLGIAYQERFEISHDPSFLELAQQSLEEAEATSRSQDRFLLWAASNLGSVLSRRYELTPDPQLLDRAIQACRHAVELSAMVAADRSLALLNLGSVLRQRYEHRHHWPDLDAAIAAFQQCAALPYAAPAVRVRAARAAGQLATLGERPEAALDAYRLAVDLLPEVAPGHSGLNDRQRRLSEFAGLAAEAAGAALTCHRTGEALRLAEAARGMLLAETLHLRTELAALRKARPLLAARFEQLRRARNNITPLAAPSPSTAGAAHQERRLSEQWKRTLAEIRSLPLFTGFLRPPAEAELLSYAGQGPVVLLTASTRRADAIIVAAGRVDSLPLPDVTSDRLVEHILAASGAVKRALRSDDLVERHAGETTLLDTLAWLWDAIAEPILQSLGTRRPTRLWWIPTGLLSLLPIHAAGRYRDGARLTVPDHVVSSYVPTLRSLGHVRNRPAPPRRASTLVAAVPHPPGYWPLPNVEMEARAVAHLAPHPRLLIGAEAVRERVLAGLRDHHHFHFAGHAVGELLDPASSRLLLQDHAQYPLTVGEIAQQDHADAELAVLAGCDVHLPGIEQVDEAISLTTAFQMTGYRNVVGSLWSLPDKVSAEFVPQLWQSVRDRGDAGEVAHVVHAGVRTLRERWPGFPSRWAGIVHVGP